MFTSTKFCRLLVSVKSSPLPQVKSVAGQFDASASDTRSQLEHDNLTVLEKVCDRNESVHGSLPNIVHDRMGKSADGSQSLSDQLRGLFLLYFILFVFLDVTV